MPSKEHTSRTRVVRVLRAIIERPHGYTLKQLAERYGVSDDTIRGDFEAIRNGDFLVEYAKIKMPPDYGQEAIQMFSQRNNPYCDLLSGSNVKKISIWQR